LALYRPFGPIDSVLNLRALSSTPTFCLCWSFIDAADYVTVTMLMAWASIERHILIFHQNWIVTNLQRWLLRHLLLIILSVYSCIYNNLAISLRDYIVHYLLPCCLIVIFSAALLSRVLYHWCRVHGRIGWRNYLKMAVQLLWISVMYFVLLLPTLVFNSAYTFGLSDVFYTSTFFNYYTVLLAPFVYAVSLPELRAKCRQLVFCRGRQAVGPVTMTMTRMMRPQTFAIAKMVICPS
jgi:hypothetical protein